MFGPGKVVSLDRTVDKPALNAGALRAALALDSLGIGEGTAIVAFMRNDFPLFEAEGAAGAPSGALVTKRSGRRTICWPNCAGGAWAKFHRMSLPTVELGTIRRKIR